MKREKKDNRKDRRDKVRRTPNQELDAFPRFRKKFCRFCKDKMNVIDYKNLNVLERLISERGKITSRRISGTCSRHQRKVSDAIKRARYLSLLPYTR